MYSHFESYQVDEIKSGITNNNTCDLCYSKCHACWWSGDFGSQASQAWYLPQRRNIPTEYTHVILTGVKFYCDSPHSLGCFALVKPIKNVINDATKGICKSNTNRRVPQFGPKSQRDRIITIQWLHRHYKHPEKSKRKTDNKSFHHFIIHWKINIVQVKNLNNNSRDGVI